ncbi:MAG: PorP/SprF family type IX secretion system membrane protein [Saprospiraceae bacterium]|nr:PorP/SprF family type IX secretion system membrane protein [Saprospiraceae bacterium]
MRIIKGLVLFVFLSVMSLSAFAQDIHFSQFYMSPLTLNPALTGVMNCNHRLTANYRNQWASVLRGNAFRTYSVSYDQKLPVGRHDYFGVGGAFWGDRAGQSNFSTLTGKLAFSYAKRMAGDRTSGHYIVAGAEAGLGQRSINFLNLTWGNQWTGDNFDPNQASGETFSRDNFLFADLSAGLLWFSVFDKYNSLYFGGAFSHLNRANLSFRDNPLPSQYEYYLTKMTAHMGGDFLVTDKFGLVPGIVTFIQGPSFELNGGTSFKFLLGNTRTEYQAFQVGLWARLANRYIKDDGATTARKGILMDALILSARFEYDQFNIGFSYDLNTSPLRSASNGNGAFELALAYKICGPERRSVYCPSF